MKLLIIFMGLLAVAACSIELKSSPCTEIFTYVQDQKTRITHGRISFVPPVDVSHILLEVIMKLPVKLPQDHTIGQIKLNKSHDSYGGIMPGEPLYYDVSFPLVEPIPTIIEIRINGRAFCTNKNYAVSSQQSTDIYLAYRLSVPRLYRAEENPSLPNGEIVDPDPDTTCGKVSSPINHRVRVASVTNPSKWPWLVAISKPGWSKQQYLCTGTLISTKHVLTAANCIPPTETKLIVSLGISDRDNLKKWGSVQRLVSNVKVHPDYDSQSVDGHADIALLTLDESVRQSFSIRPLCVMTKSVELSELQGEKGFLVGWGMENKDNQPTIVRVPIVTKNTCSHINPSINEVVSEKSFCGGRKDGNGACHVDVGSSLVFYHEDLETYFLRGVASKFLLEEEPNESKECIKPQFIIFADAAKFSDWIEANTVI